MVMRKFLVKLFSMFFFEMYGKRNMGPIMLFDFLIQPLREPLSVVPPVEKGNRHKRWPD
jgi:hypothetical protein